MAIAIAKTIRPGDKLVCVKDQVGGPSFVGMEYTVTRIVRRYDMMIKIERKLTKVNSHIKILRIGRVDEVNIDDSIFVSNSILYKLVRCDNLDGLDVEP